MALCQTVPEGARRPRRCQTAPDGADGLDGARWCQTVPDGARRCQRVPEGARRLLGYFGMQNSFLH